MRRPARWLFTLCSAASLVVCICLWISSYSPESGPNVLLFVKPSSETYNVLSIDGAVYLPLDRDTRNLPPGFHLNRAFGAIESLNFEEPQRCKPIRLFRAKRFRQKNWIIIQYWFLTLASAARPLWVGAARLKAHQRQTMGHCACGYDLRATPGRCPECGTAPAAAANAESPAAPPG